MTAGWCEGRLAGFDTETSGLDVETCRIVTASIPQCGGRLPTTIASWLADPGIDIPARATAVHGITTNHARTHGRPAAEVVEQLVTALTQVVLGGLPVVVMNAPYDLTLLDREARRHGITPLTDTIGSDLRVIDPLGLDRHVDPDRRSRRTLTHLCTRYRVRIDAAHDAAADAIAACRVAWRIARTHPAIGGASLDDLHEQQTAWAAEQAAEMRDFLTWSGRPDRAAQVRGDWPLVPHQPAHQQEIPA